MITKRKRCYVLRIVRCCILCFIVVFTLPNPYKAADLYENQQIPSYAKWGLLAMQKTKERYPKANIVDYLHIGRETKTPNVAVERFKLWLQENGREYGVLIEIEFELQTERVLYITFTETDR